ncbi:MAG: FtsW/RodA/SpoVE family cell cycle protein [Lachnospiraceae bacterium]|nr:FtsW/RodA/SpoVE family cell cycle protein [Lachnospiraceae bacterium]
MTTVILGLSRYVLALLFALYTLHCFLGFGFGNEDDRKGLAFMQAVFLVLIHTGGFAVLYFKTGDPEVIFFCALQEVLLIGCMVLMRILYPGCSRLLINNMCVFLAIGFVMLYRLSPGDHLRQFAIAVFSLIITLPVPYLVRRIREPWRYTYALGISGIVLILLVAVLGQVTRGSRLSISIAGVSFQSSEFAKILFILFLSGLLSEDCFFGDSRKDKELRLINTLLSGIFALSYVFIMVISRDLGGAAIFFMIYVFLLYFTLKKPWILPAAALSGAAGGFWGYKLFPHVRNRFLAWRDPFSYIEGQGYQITQSLFAIGTGSWFGMGLNDGSPDKIPIVTRDFIFSAIAEELGCIFAVCLILVCISTFLMFINAALSVTDPYFRLLALGISVSYAFQVFLNIGGVIKFIPLTGVTLPLVSYGGSSLLSTALMFALIQGITIRE